ncbi:M48 family metallopeptidase [Noviherbaspirillum galbum]|uniref:M48 family metalloprotease n=1 Tax=Noviherbaspirillum galbum TaxID=2709383 RepID=A0A6B3SQA1_9BURK|nr:M48 family metallopeptidase [Noviherbaspirillum galbum]NEX62933.1 M48 family metalloprotease [Noviherbaspirillum galbum]
MRHIRSTLAALLLCASTGAMAQLPFAIPGLDKLSDKLGSKLGNLNLENTLGNLTKAAKDTDESEEIRLGQEFAATLLGAKPLAPDPALQQYVNALGRWLALQTERPDLPWTFGVLDDPGFNAFATPGGYVFVTRGLVARMRNEAELAGVLAHEIGHVLKKHHLRAVQKQAGMALVSDVIGASNRGSNGPHPEARAALLNVGRKLYVSGLDKDDEFEADRLGVVIAARAGYDAFGLPAVLQMLQAQNGSAGEFALLFRTHPAPATRIQMLDRQMGDRFDRLPGTAGETMERRLAQFGR